MASMMAVHVGGGSTCFSQCFNISLKHRRESLGLSCLITSKIPSSMLRKGPMSSHLAETLVPSSLINIGRSGGSRYSSQGPKDIQRLLLYHTKFIIAVVVLMCMTLRCHNYVFGCVVQVLVTAHKGLIYSYQFVC